MNGGGKTEGLSICTGRRGAKEKHCFVKGFIILPRFWNLGTVWTMGRMREITQTSSSYKARFQFLEPQLLKHDQNLGKKYSERDLTDNWTSKNEIGLSPSQNWRRQIEGRTWSLPAAPVGGGSFSIGRLHLLPACRTAAENMAPSFHDFHAEFIAGSSPDDSHLALETIFSCFSFSTYSWRVPAIYVVSPPLAPLARSAMRLAAESRARTSLFPSVRSKAHHSTSEVNSSRLYCHKDR